MTYNFGGLFRLVEQAEDRAPGITLDEVADMLKVHRHTAGEAVRQTTGQQFRVWSRQRRLARAARLLKTECTLTIGQVAALSGYACIQSLDRAFQRAYGMTPSGWRLASDAHD